MMSGQISQKLEKVVLTGDGGIEVVLLN